MVRLCIGMGEAAGRAGDIFIAVLGMMAFVLGGVVLVHASRSPLFTVTEVQVSRLDSSAPVDAQTLRELAAVAVGRQNLVFLDLRQIESRILSHPWIRFVRLEKRFPSAVVLTPVFRNPQALLQSKNGSLQYVDSDGHVFDRVHLGRVIDLPVLAPVFSDPDKRLTALLLLEAWSAVKIRGGARIDLVQFDAERGYRFLVTYAHGKVTVDFGDIDPVPGAADFAFDQMRRLGSVFQYLLDHQIVAKQIWANIGKKMVVKIAQRS